MARAAALALLLAPLRAAAAPTCAALTIAPTPVNTVAPYFASFNIDSSRDRLFFDLNWTDPRLITLAAAAGGARIRFGGTGNDHLFYGLPGAPPCAPTVDGVYECLNATTFDAVADLSAAASAPLIFGVNIHPAGGPSPPAAAWNPTNARALLTYARDRARARGGAAFAALELGERVARAPRPPASRLFPNSTRAPPRPLPPQAMSRTRS